MKFPSFSRDSWLIAITIAMGGLCLFALPNSPASATSPSASPSSPPSSSPASPPAPELPLLDKLQSNLPMLNSELEAVIKALGGVKTELTPEQLRLAWTDVDTQVDQLCTQTAYPLKKRIEQQSNKDTTDQTIVDLFNQIGATCDNINRNTDRLKANNQQSSESQQTVDNPETKIKQELQNIKQLLNQVKEWVSQEQEKKYREGLDKRLDFQQNLQYLTIVLLLFGSIVIAVVLYKKGEGNITMSNHNKPGSSPIQTWTPDQNQMSKETGKIIEEISNLSTNQLNITDQLKKLTTEISEIKNTINIIQRDNNQGRSSVNLSEQFSGIITDIIEKEVNNSSLGKLLVKINEINEIKKSVDNYESLFSTDFSNSSNNFDASQQQVQNQISNLSQEITSINSSLSTISTQLTQLTQLNDNSAATSAQKNNEVEELRLQLEQITGEVEQLKITIQELESEKSQSQENIQQLNTTLQTEQETIRHLKLDLKEKQNRLDLLEQQIAIKDSTINSLESENRNAKPNKTQEISQELQSLVNEYNQNNGNLNVLNYPIPVKDNSNLFKHDYKLEKTNEDKAKFYIVSCQDKHYLFPKLRIPSEVACDIFKYYFEVPQINTYPVSIKLIQPSEMKQISEKDSWELVDKNSKGKVQ